MSAALRKNPYQVDLLIAGYDAVPPALQPQPVPPPPSTTTTTTTTTTPSTAAPSRAVPTPSSGAGVGLAVPTPLLSSVPPASTASPAPGRAATSPAAPTVFITPPPLPGRPPSGPSLFFLDYLGTIQALPFAVHGRASMLLLGYLDKNYRPNMTEDELLTLLRGCQTQLKERFLLKQDRWVVKVVNDKGVHQIPV